MTQSPKKKKQNINRELFVGGGAMVLMLPLIALAIIGTLIGFFVGVLLVTLQDVPSQQALTMFTTYGLFMAIFSVLLWRIAQRIRLLFNRKQHLKAEQERVSHLIDTTSADERLKEQDLSQDTQQKSPIEKSVRGRESSF